MYLLFIGLLALLGVGHAQSLPKDYTFSNVGMTFLSISTDARSAGLGEMGVAILPDASSHQQNAAKYLFLDSRYKGGIHLFYIPWLRQLIDDMNISGVSAHYKIAQLQVGLRGQPPLVFPPVSPTMSAVAASRTARFSKS